MTTLRGQYAHRKEHIIAIVRFETSTVECVCGWSGVADRDFPGMVGYAWPPVRAWTANAVKRLFSEHRAEMGLRSHDGTAAIEGFGAMSADPQHRLVGLRVR